MTIRSSDSIIQAFNLVSTKAAKQPTKEGMGQMLRTKCTYSEHVQKRSALAGVEGETSPS